MVDFPALPGQEEKEDIQPNEEGQEEATEMPVMEEEEQKETEKPLMEEDEQKETEQPLMEEEEEEGEEGEEGEFIVYKPPTQPAGSDAGPSSIVCHRVPIRSSTRTGPKLLAPNVLPEDSTSSGLLEFCRN